MVEVCTYERLRWLAIFPHPADETSGLGATIAYASADAMRPWFGKGDFYRVSSMVNGGSTVETNLFEGLRD